LVSNGTSEGADLSNQRGKEKEGTYLRKSKKKKRHTLGGGRELFSKKKEKGDGRGTQHQSATVECGGGKKFALRPRVRKWENAVRRRSLRGKRGTMEAAFRRLQKLREAVRTFPGSKLTLYILNAIGTEERGVEARILVKCHLRRRSDPGRWTPGR